MTDARMPERWLNDRRLLRLSDSGHRLFLTALMWSVANRSDGVLDDVDLSLIPAVDAKRARELETAGLWRRDTGRWVILDFESTQTTSGELARLEKLRRVEREKQARKRARRSADSDGTVPGDGPPGTHQEGQDRQRQARTRREGPTSEREVATEVDGQPAPRRDALALVSPDSGHYSGSDLDDFSDPYFAELEEEERQRRGEWGDQDAG